MPACRRQRLLALTVALGGLLAFLTTMRKGVWADEVLHFALAAVPGAGATVRATFASIGNLNHGQTGVLMLINAFLLKAVGASYLALRLPSYLAYATSVVAGFLALGELGVSFAVGLLFAFCLGLSQLSLEHGWEARPYIFLAGTVAAYLWAWRRYARGAKGSLALLLGTAVAGVLFHPFFVAYAGLYPAASFACEAGVRRRVLERLRNRGELAVIAVSALLLAVLFLALGKVSWFQTYGHDFGYDPFEYIKRDKPLPRFMLGTFFFPVSIVVVPALALLAAGLVALRKRVPGLLGPWLALCLTLAITQAVVAQSVLKAHYWVLQRQWIAGNVLAFLAAALLVEFVFRLAPLPERARAAVAWLVLAGGLLVCLAGAWKHVQVPFEPVVPFERTAALRAEVAAKKEPTTSDFQNLAHQNLLEGGPVWPELARLYGIQPDGAEH